MDNVRQLEPAPPVVDAGLVSFLGDLLRKAEEGKLISFAFAGQTNSGEVIRGHAMDHPKSNIFELLGGLEYEKHALNSRIDTFIGDEYPL